MRVTVTYCCVNDESPMYIYYVEAEANFDFVPNSKLFIKAVYIIPDQYWRILVFRACSSFRVYELRQYTHW